MEPLIRRIARCLGPLLAASGIALTLLAIGAGTVAAECDGPEPSFRHALATAKRIVIGDVVAVQDGGLAHVGVGGRSSRFTLRVRNVLRGDAPAVMHIRDLPTQPCAPGVVARVGDRIALAFDAVDYTPAIPVNAVAWLRGTPPPYEGIETVTLAELSELLGFEIADTSTAALGPLPRPSSVLPLLVLPGLVGFLLGWRRVGSRRLILAP
jgi:hypothetical protein